MSEEPFRIVPSLEWRADVQEMHTEPPPDLGAACFMLMAAIDAKGGNPRFPHGGDAVSDALWHMVQMLAAQQ